MTMNTNNWSLAMPLYGCPALSRSEKECHMLWNLLHACPLSVLDTMHWTCCMPRGFACLEVSSRALSLEMGIGNCYMIPPFKRKKNTYLSLDNQRVAPFAASSTWLKTTYQVLNSSLPTPSPSYKLWPRES